MTVKILHLRQRLGAAKSDETGKTWCGMDADLMDERRTRSQADSTREGACKTCKRAYDAWARQGH